MNENDADDDDVSTTTGELESDSSDQYTDDDLPTEIITDFEVNDFI